ncbi:hypothetical protein FH972_021528 [Carpinus fangiana]|uniref:Uncharacterized protein n=1 Tax=Carpinus fangiana TaxID=176857 RepID=A0A5N6KPY5_9ROSI|nr:hypothetical protein FH972_021528 [Carpinus fangiana]
MQRGAAYGPAQSPPLHHPVPQHVSTVPQFRSPPPPSQSANGYGYGGQQQGGGFAQPQFGGFMNEQTAQMGYQFMKTLTQGTGQSLSGHELVKVETLFQRIQLLCRQQADHCSVPLEASTVDKATGNSWGGRAGWHVPAASGRRQQPRHVHSSDGVRHIHPPLRTTRRPPRGISSGASGSDRHNSHCGGGTGAPGPEAGVLSSFDYQRQPIAGPGGLLGIQICWHHRHDPHWRDWQPRSRHWRLDWLDGLSVHLPCAGLFLVTIAQVCATAGECTERRGGSYADGGSITAQPADAVSLRLLVRRAVGVHVDPESAGSTVDARVMIRGAKGSDARVA